MFLIILVTVLIAVSLWIGITLVLPPMTSSGTSTPSVSLPQTNNAVKSDEEPVIPVETPTQSIMEKPDFPDACYDKITLREKGRVYVFKSKLPLEEGVNPKIFADLPTYRVWAEQILGEGMRCPVLFYDPSAPAYIHPEEEYPPEVAMTRAAVEEGKRYKAEVEVEFNPRNPPYVVTDGSVKVDTLEIRDHKSSYIRTAMTEPARYVPHDSVNDPETEMGPAYAEAKGKLTKVHPEDYFTRSRRDALGLGADQSLPAPPRNLRDVPEWKVRELLKSADPSLAGASLRRTGISQYQIESIPERQRERERDMVKGWSGSYVDSPMPLDLLAYGGTIVPVKNVNRLFQ
jgi:hypothetical protein